MLSKKYKLIPHDKYLFRLQALRDFGDVKAGDLGGLVKDEFSLSHVGTCWVYDNAVVEQQAKVIGQATVRENALIYGRALIHANACVSGRAEISGEANIGGNAQILGNAIVQTRARIFGCAIEKAKPLFISLPKDDITLTTDGMCAVGCLQYPLSYWVAHYQEIGKKHGYLPEEIALYGHIFRSLIPFLTGDFLR